MSWYNTEAVNPIVDMNSRIGLQCYLKITCSVDQYLASLSDIMFWLVSLDFNHSEVILFLFFVTKIASPLKVLLSLITWCCSIGPLSNFSLFKILFLFADLFVWVSLPCLPGHWFFFLLHLVCYWTPLVYYSVIVFFSFMTVWYFLVFSIFFF